MKNRDIGGAPPWSRGGACSGTRTARRRSSRLPNRGLGLAGVEEEWAVKEYEPSEYACPQPRSCKVSLEPERSRHSAVSLKSDGSRKERSR